MYKTFAFSSLLLAASASPLMRRQNVTSTSTATDTVTVTLANSAIGIEDSTFFESTQNGFSTSDVATAGPFTTINVDVADTAVNQALRCSAFDEDGNEHVATRGANIDITFSDAGNGEWTFAADAGVYVARIACDPAFVAVSPEDKGVSVLLQNQAIELGTTTSFDDASIRNRSPPTGGSGPFETIEIILDTAVDPDLRCKVLDRKGRAIVAQRGENIDTTFSDANKGLWTFVDGPKRVSRVICDPKFVADPQQ